MTLEKVSDEKWETNVHYRFERKNKKLENHSCPIGLVIHIDAHLNIFLARFILFHNVVENHTDVNQVDCKANTDKPKEKIFSVYKKIVKLKGEICNAFLECKETFTTFF